MAFACCMRDAVRSRLAGRKDYGPATARSCERKESVPRSDSYQIRADPPFQALEQSRWEPSQEQHHVRALEWNYNDDDSVAGSLSLSPRTGTGRRCFCLTPNPFDQRQRLTPLVPWSLDKSAQPPMPALKLENYFRGLMGKTAFFLPQAAGSNRMDYLPGVNKNGCTP